LQGWIENSYRWSAGSDNEKLIEMQVPMIIGDRGGIVFLLRKASLFFTIALYRSGLKKIGEFAFEVT
jgi:hypothetical protein